MKRSSVLIEASFVKGLEGSLLENAFDKAFEAKDERSKGPFEERVMLENGLRRDHFIKRRCLAARLRKGMATCEFGEGNHLGNSLSGAPTNYYMRRIREDALYPRCSGATENTVHIFRECLISLEARLGSGVVAKNTLVEILALEMVLHKAIASQFATEGHACLQAVLLGIYLVRLALNYHGTSEKPVASRIALLDSRYKRYQDACIGTVEATLSSGMTMIKAQKEAEKKEAEERKRQKEKALGKIPVEKESTEKIPSPPRQDYNQEMLSKISVLQEHEDSPTEESSSLESTSKDFESSDVNFDLQVMATA
ncbi:hypothetical protein Godav_002622 [Gossypium davidsonii]|uniref:Uncharacterized protein n=1 Tax=Gossypium davidsonii TaxID=34287 RepID=A0A7J8SWN7_GOSDV|nr:hypothetical protein [Gossypium davidsonii]